MLGAVSLEGINRWLIKWVSVTAVQSGSRVVRWLEFSWLNRDNYTERGYSLENNPRTGYSA